MRLRLAGGTAAGEFEYVGCNTQVNVRGSQLFCVSALTFHAALTAGMLSLERIRIRAPADLKAFWAQPFEGPAAPDPLPI